MLGQERDLVIVPSAAIQRGTQGTYVYVVRPDSTVNMRPVKTGIADGDQVAISAGLAAGDR
ncbi:hypothetical protein ABTL61_19870, partial [Acinetobacter baumannii]